MGERKLRGWLGEIKRCRRAAPNATHWTKPSNNSSTERNLLGENQVTIAAPNATHWGKPKQQ